MNKLRRGVPVRRLSVQANWYNPKGYQGGESYNRDRKQTERLLEWAEQHIWPEILKKTQPLLKRENKA